MKDSPSYDDRVLGRKRPMMQPNYHTMSNNAVFPPDRIPEVQHFHSKVTKDGRPQLAPTLRYLKRQETT